MATYIKNVVLANESNVTTEAGVSIVSVDSSWNATVNSKVETLVDLTTIGNTIIGNASSDTLVINSTVTGTSVITNTIANVASAWPWTVRSVIWAISNATTMTSWNLVWVRGATTIASASGWFFYWVQGKIIATGTLSGSSWTAWVFGQLDISATTLNAGQTAAIWWDYGTSSGTMTDTTGARGIVMTNTTSAILHAQDYRYGNATYLLELAGAGGTLNYITGSNGGGANVYITVLINGVPAKIAAKYVS